MWHVCGVRFLHLLPILLALTSGGCASWSKKKPEDNTAKENSRAIEQRRMRALDHGDVTSARGAEILVADYTKQFDPSRSGVGTARTFGTGGARTKEFNYQEKYRPESYQTRGFAGTKSNAASERKFATKAANTNGQYVIPNADQDVAGKAARTKELWDGSKVAATRDLRDGDRTYLGQERKNLGKIMDPKELANWRSGGGETVIYSGTTVDRVGTLKQLSIEDVRELLNKNK